MLAILPGFPSSRYFRWYSGGMNRAGLLAVLVPGVITMVWFLPMSWLIGVPAGFVIYLVLHPILQPRPA